MAPMPELDMKNGSTGKPSSSQISPVVPASLASPPFHDDGSMEISIPELIERDWPSKIRIPRENSTGETPKIAEEFRKYRPGEPQKAEESIHAPQSINPNRYNRSSAAKLLSANADRPAETAASLNLGVRPVRQEDDATEPSSIAAEDASGESADNATVSIAGTLIGVGILQNTTGASADEVTGGVDVDEFLATRQPATTAPIPNIAHEPQIVHKPSTARKLEVDQEPQIDPKQQIARKPPIAHKSKIARKPPIANKSKIDNSPHIVHKSFFKLATQTPQIGRKSFLKHASMGPPTKVTHEDTMRPGIYGKTGQSTAAIARFRAAESTSIQFNDTIHYNDYPETEFEEPSVRHESSAGRLPHSAILLFLSIIFVHSQ
ncbi:Hypothetical protein NTJ_13011 [Nesidiocoris tenuis]|uniref:Uncharacterized protein n=1 Tax=Nesidiocoris tenuis TaxID=355587 RepID=A0ABN7B723_9HEMI|nr:Hypothetical protein NTJ_13011 [Nesidiocoris tenuis]